MSGCGCGCTGNMKTTDGAKAVGSESKQLLEALAKCAGPCGSKEIVEATGLDKQVVSNQITELKKQGLVDSPVRCKYGITAEGRASLD